MLSYNQNITHNSIILFKMLLSYITQSDSFKNVTNVTIYCNKKNVTIDFKKTSKML